GDPGAGEIDRASGKSSEDGQRRPEQQPRDEMHWGHPPGAPIGWDALRLEKLRARLAVAGAGALAHPQAGLGHLRLLLGAKADALAAVPVRKRRALLHGGAEARGRLPGSRGGGAIGYPAARWRPPSIGWPTST